MADKQVPHMYPFIKGFSFDESIIDWKYWRNELPNASYDSIIFTEIQYQKLAYIENERKKKKRNRAISQIFM